MSLSELSRALSKLVRMLERFRGNSNVTMEDLWFEYHNELKPLLRDILEELRELNENLRRCKHV